MVFRLRMLRDYFIRPAIDEVGIGAVNSVLTKVTHEICFEVTNVGRLHILSFHCVLRL
jgi:hypothetical protein